MFCWLIITTSTVRTVYRYGNDWLTVTPTSGRFFTRMILVHDTRLVLQYQAQTGGGHVGWEWHALTYREDWGMGFWTRTDGNMKIGKQDLKNNFQFEYHGHFHLWSDARRRVNAAWLKWENLQVTNVLWILQSKSVSQIAMYGGECRSMTRKREQAFHIV